MKFYKRYPGDFMSATSHLSLAEKGAYNALLDHYYATRSPLPNDIRTLCRIAGAVCEEETAAVARIADEFFPPNGDGRRHNKRADREIESAEELSEKARRSARARWTPGSER